MLWYVLRLIFKTSSVTPGFFYALNLILTFPTCSQISFKKCFKKCGASVLQVYALNRIIKAYSCDSLRNTVNCFTGKPSEFPANLSSNRSISKKRKRRDIVDVRMLMLEGNCINPFKGKGQDLVCLSGDKLATKYCRAVFKLINRRLVSSVGRAPVCCAGGRGFEPQTGPTLKALK